MSMNKDTNCVAVFVGCFVLLCFLRSLERVEDNSVKSLHLCSLCGAQVIFAAKARAARINSKRPSEWGS